MLWPDEMGYRMPGEGYPGFYPPDKPPLPQCECGAELGGDAVLYTYKGSGIAVGCGLCVDSYQCNEHPHFVCNCLHFDPDNTETIYTARGTDCVLGCSECLQRKIGSEP